MLGLHVVVMTGAGLYSDEKSRQGGWETFMLGHSLPVEEAGMEGTMLSSSGHELDLQELQLPCVFLRGAMDTTLEGGVQDTEPSDHFFFSFFF